MTEKDETLQIQLDALKRGVPLEKILAELPPEDHDLAPLIRLAAAAREVDHPLMSPESARIQQEQVKAAARALTTPLRPAVTRPAPSRLTLPAWVTSHKWQFALGTAMALILVFTAGAFGLGLFLAGPASAHSAQVVDVNGMVEVTSSQNNNDWHFISNGDRVTQGQRIRTYADSGATLVFFEGSRTAIGADADVTLTTLKGRWGNVLQVQLTQNSGLTGQSVIPLRSSAGYFQVLTPAGEASVHGTSFTVDVNPDGEALFAVTRGRVQVKNANSEVFLTAGQATAVHPNGDPEHPGYQFALQGPVTAHPGTADQVGQWAISSVPFEVTSQTEIVGTFEVGDFASARGRILDSGQWVADSIEPAGQETVELMFTGVLTAKAGDFWTIGGRPVMVTKDTERSSRLNIGATVEVTFMVLRPNNIWVALKIDSLEEEEPTPTPTATRHRDQHRDADPDSDLDRHTGYGYTDPDLDRHTRHGYTDPHSDLDRHTRHGYPDPHPDHDRHSRHGYPDSYLHRHGYAEKRYPTLRQPHPDPARGDAPGAKVRRTLRGDHGLVLQGLRLRRNRPGLRPQPAIRCARESDLRPAQ